MIQPSTTARGSRSKAIYILEPMATAIARSILSLIATIIAVTCLLAFPTIERRIRSTKAFEIEPLLQVTILIELTK